MTGTCWAQLGELKAREDFLKRELSRATELIGRGASTTQAFERASSDLRQNQALIAVQMERLANYTITAPMDGIVLRRDGEVGEIAEAGQVLFRIGVPDGDRVRKRRADIGIRGTRAIEILAGVNEGDRVVSPIPVGGLVDGQRVNPVHGAKS